MDLSQLAALAAFAFLGASVQASTGFGLSAVAAPFFMLILDSGAAIQILALANFALAISLAPRLRGTAPRGLLANLLVGSLAGAPLGLAIFLTLETSLLKVAIGLIVVVFALILLARELGLFAQPDAVTETGAQSRRAAELTVGLLAGTLGVAFAFFAPPIIFYLLLVRAGKEATRATMLVYFAVTYGMATLVHGLWGGMTGQSWGLALLLLPAVLLGTFAGHRLAARLNDRRVRLLILMTLTGSGGYAIWSTLAA